MNYGKIIYLKINYSITYHLRVTIPANTYTARRSGNVVAIYFRNHISY